MENKEEKIVQMLERFIDENEISSIEDIYELPEASMAFIERLCEESGFLPT